MVIFTPKMVKNIFEIIFILTAAKNHTSNFADSPFGPDYCSSLNVSLTATSNQINYSMHFQKILFFSFLNYSNKSSLVFVISPVIPMDKFQKDFYWIYHIKYFWVYGIQKSKMS